MSVDLGSFAADTSLTRSETELPYIGILCHVFKQASAVKSCEDILRAFAISLSWDI